MAIEIDPSLLGRDEQTKLLNGSVVPRPIALVTTAGSCGVNAAPFSWFNVVGAEPAMLMFSMGIPVGPRAGSVKDTLQNLREVPECVVHVASHGILRQLELCGAEHERGVNEIELAGLTAAPSRKVRPPRIEESPVAFECKLAQLVPVGNVPYHVAFVEVVHMHYLHAVVDERLHVDPALLDPIARLAAGFLRVNDATAKA